jgi:hypothetical protein
MASQPEITFPLTPTAMETKEFDGKRRTGALGKAKYYHIRLISCYVTNWLRAGRHECSLLLVGRPPQD